MKYYSGLVLVFSGLDAICQASTGGRSLQLPALELFNHLAGNTYIQRMFWKISP